jgi:hypothetical protein
LKQEHVMKIDVRFSAAALLLTPPAFAGCQQGGCGRPSTTYEDTPKLCGTWTNTWICKPGEKPQD